MVYSYLYNLFHQFHRTFLCRVVSAQLATKSTGKDGFFNQVDLFQNCFGSFFGSLFFSEKIVKDTDNFGLFVISCNRNFKITQCSSLCFRQPFHFSCIFTDTAPNNLHFAVMCGLIGGGLEEQIINFLNEHTDTKLVIIDTLQKVRDSKGSTGKAGMYGNDYDDISSIKRIADEYNIAVLAIHHLRKLKDSDDPFNEVSGSTGIIGAADTNFILKRKRTKDTASLLVSGRDVEYQELTLQLNELIWELVERKNSDDIHKAEIPKFLFRVVDFMQSRDEWTGTASELIAEMKESETTPNIVTKYLGQFSRDTLEPVGIEYKTKRTGKSRLIKFIRSDSNDANDEENAI